MTARSRKWNWGIVCTVALVGLMLAGPVVGPALGSGGAAAADATTNETTVATDATTTPNGTGNGTATPDNVTAPENGPSGDSVEIARYNTQTGNWDNYTLYRDDDNYASSNPLLPDGTSLSDIISPGTGYGKRNLSDRGTTDQYPWSAVGSVDYSCSGAVVEDNHVLTAAHCVYKDGEWDSDFEPGGTAPLFIPGLSQDASAADKYDITDVQTYKDWYDSEPDTFDIAVLTLNESIADETGTYGYESYNLNVDRSGYPYFNKTEYYNDVHVTGYPARDEVGYVSTLFEMWDLIGNGEGTDILVGAPACTLNDRCHQYSTAGWFGEFTAEGTSGGPTWQPDDVSRPIIMSVNKGATFGNDADPVSDGIGIRINDKKYSDVGQMIENGPSAGGGSGGSVSTSLILDRSGSMGGSALSDAKRAAELYVGLSGDDANVSIVSYASGSRVDQSLTELGEGNGRYNVRSAIDSIGAGGLTNVHAGLDDGLDELDEAPDSDTQAAILLSDGFHNTGPSKSEILNDLVPEYNDRGYCLYTVAFGGGADDAFLEDVAQEADCGEFLSTSSSSSSTAAPAGASQPLRDIYEQIRQDVADADTIDDSVGTLGAGETTTGTVSIGTDLSDATFRLRISGSQSAPDRSADAGRPSESAGGAVPPQPVGESQAAAAVSDDVALVDPSGDTVTASDPDVDVSTVDDTVIYRVDDPDSGDWQYELTNTDATDRTYEVRVTGETIGRTDSLDVDVTDATDSAAPGETVDVDASIGTSGDGTVTKTAVLFAEGSRVDSQRVTVDGDAPTTVEFQWDTTGAPAGNATVAVGAGVSSDAAEVSIACVPRDQADRSTPDSSICPDKRDEDRNDDDTGGGRSASDPSGGDDRRDRGRSDDDRRGGDSGTSRGDGR